MNNKYLHVLTAIILVGFLLILNDPFMYWMPKNSDMIALLGSTVLLVLWTGVIIYEQARDEREAAHQARAGHVAYLSGILVLTVALIVQGLAHNIDPWITIALGVMVIAKIGTRFYNEIHS